MAGSETAFYLYCLGPAAGLPRIAAAGVDERSRVSLWFCDEIGAVLSEVPLDDFRGEQAEARLRDLSWLGPRVCRHEAVIEEAMRRGPVLPARFATLFASADSLQDSWFGTAARSPDSSPRSAPSRSGRSKGCWFEPQR